MVAQSYALVEAPLQRWRVPVRSWSTQKMQSVWDMPWRDSFAIPLNANNRKSESSSELLTFHGRKQPDRRFPCILKL